MGVGIEGACQLAGSSRVAITVGMGGFAAMWYQVQELGALRVGPLEGCPTSLEPDSVRELDSQSNLAQGKGGKKHWQTPMCGLLCVT